MEITTAILMPQLEHTFTLQFTNFGGYDPTELELLSMQVISMQVNYVDHIISIVIEQPKMVPNMHKLMERLTTTSGTIIMLPGVGDDSVDGAVMYVGCDCINHLFRLTYANTSTPAIHNLEFSFRSVEIRQDNTIVSY